MYPVDSCYGLYQCLVYDLCFKNSVEGLIKSHEVTDVFDEVVELNPDVTDKIISGPSTNDNDCLWVYPGYEELHGES